MFPPNARKLPGSDWRKVALARLISGHTTASHQWLADNLKMRSAANVSQVLQMKQAEDEALHVPPARRRWINSERAIFLTAETMVGEAFWFMQPDPRNCELNWSFGFGFGGGSGLVRAGLWTFFVN